MSPLNSVNLTYFVGRENGRSAKGVTFHSLSDSLSGETQLNHIPFTGMDIYSEHAAAGELSQWRGAGQACQRASCATEPTWP